MTTTRVPSACEEYRLTAGPQVRKARYFQITIAAGNVTQQSGPESLADAYVAAHAGVSRLLAVANQCRLFNAARLRTPSLKAIAETTALERWRSAYLRDDRGTVWVDVTPSARDDARFWWWLVSSNAQPFVLLPAAAQGALIDSFVSGFDPVVVGNLGATVAESARGLARRRTAKDAIALLLTRTVHSVDLTVFASRERITVLFEMALAHARRTDGFASLHCTDWVRPIELGSPALWTKVNSSRDELPLLIDALRQARDAPNYDERRTLNALVAAELVAAMSGQPPAVFYGRDSQVDQAIRQWANSARSRRLPPEAVELARDTVNSVLAQSPLPDRLWRSEQRRKAWRESIADLARRLDVVESRTPSGVPSDRVR